MPASSLAKGFFKPNAPPSLRRALIPPPPPPLLGFSLRPLEKRGANLFFFLYLDFPATKTEAILGKSFRLFDRLKICAETAFPTLFRAWLGPRA